MWVRDKDWNDREREREQGSATEIYLNNAAVDDAVRMPHAVVVEPLPDHTICRLRRRLTQHRVDRKQSVSW